MIMSKMLLELRITNLEKQVSVMYNNLTNYNKDFNYHYIAYKQHETLVRITEKAIDEAEEKLNKLYKENAKK